jgi:hypothetical protein
MYRIYTCGSITIPEIPGIAYYTSRRNSTVITEPAGIFKANI